LLLANKAEVNATNSHGQTPLHLAAILGYKDLANLLLANKADINANGYHGRTPLLCAAIGGHKDVVELLWSTSPMSIPRMTTARRLYTQRRIMARRIWWNCWLANKADVNA